MTTLPANYRRGLRAALDHQRATKIDPVDGAEVARAARMFPEVRALGDAQLELFRTALAAQLARGKHYDRAVREAVREVST